MIPKSLDPAWPCHRMEYLESQKETMIALARGSIHSCHRPTEFRSERRRVSGVDSFVLSSFLGNTFNRSTFVGTASSLIL